MIESRMADHTLAKLDRYRNADQRRINKIIEKLTNDGIISLTVKEGLVTAVNGNSSMTFWGYYYDNLDDLRNG